MSNFDWNRYLQQHLVFADLRDNEITALLDKKVSLEKFVSPNQTIVKEGEQDQSIFLIGEGSANVFLKGPNEQDVFLNSLGKGELIGEMALFEHKPRSATVIASEPCTLLEFHSREFLKLLESHPEIGFKLLSKLSERLRDLGDNVLNTKLKDVEEKIKHVNAKLDTEIKIIDASLKATHTVFDQTSKRAHEVIDSADRSRTRFTVAASTIGTIFTLIFSALSYFGFNELKNVSEIKEQVKTDYQKITKDFKMLEEQSNKAMQLSKSVETTTNDLDQVRVRLDETNRQMKNFYKKTLVSQFHSEMDSDIEKAKQTYFSILSFKDSEVSDALYKQILVDILSGDSPTRERYTEILNAGIDNLAKSITEREKTLSYYLLLSTFILNGDSKQYNDKIQSYNNTLRSLGEPVKETAEIDFGADIFEEYILAESESIDQDQKDKIDKIKKIWELIP